VTANHLLTQGLQQLRRDLSTPEACLRGRMGTLVERIGALGRYDCKAPGCPKIVEFNGDSPYSECATHRRRRKKYGSYEILRNCNHCGKEYDSINGGTLQHCPECRQIVIWCTPMASVGRKPTRALIHYRYGLTPFQFYEIWQDQEGRCKLCGFLGQLPFEWTRETRLVVDHDHTCCPGKMSCGKCLRGLLCETCNLILGHYEKRKPLGYLEIEQFDKYLLERIVLHA